MSIYDFKVKDIKSEEKDLADFKGKVLLVVNTATGCGFTPQYEGLQKLYDDYKESGFEVLDFPCNQFGNQAPGTDGEIQSFCQLKYNVSFPQFSKIDVNGENESPLYTFLKKAIPDEEADGLKNKMTMKAIAKISTSTKNPGDINWNFTKFLVDREGNPVKRYSPTEKPEKIAKDIEALL